MTVFCWVLQARSGGRGELQEARTLMTQLKTEKDALRAQLDVIQVYHRSALSLIVVLLFVSKVSVFLSRCCRACDRI
jgi:hypothetical protein